MNARARHTVETLERPSVKEQLFDIETNLHSIRDAGQAYRGPWRSLRALWSEYTDGQGDDLSLGKWLERTFKVSSIRSLPQEAAPKAITALKAMKAKKAAKAKERTYDWQ